MRGEKPKPRIKRFALRSPEQSREVAHSPFIIPPPHTLNGYTLEPSRNLTWQVTADEKAHYQAKAERARALQDPRQGYFESVKVNITSAGVRTVTHPNGHIDETIVYETAPSLYSLLTAIDHNTSYDTARRLTHSGATVVAITGDNKIILGSRPRRAGQFPRTIEASASGAWDGDMADENQLINPTPQMAKERIMTEFYEETGTPMEVVDNSHFIVMGIGQAPTKKNWDILWLAQLPQDITEDRMREFHHEHKGNGHDYSNDPMAGHLTFIDANPQAIEKFLTRMPTPSSPMAQTALLYAGYMLTMKEADMQRKSQEEAAALAQRWMNKTEKTMRANNHRLDIRARRFRTRETLGELTKTVGTYLGRKPEQMLRHVEKLRMARLRRPYYDQRYSPEDQGLMGARQGLQKLGFIPKDPPPTGTLIDVMQELKRREEHSLQ